jgi:hypothetical protein
MEGPLTICKRLVEVCVTQSMKAIIFPQNIEKAIAIPVFSMVVPAIAHRLICD